MIRVDGGVPSSASTAKKREIKIKILQQQKSGYSH